MSLKAHLCPKLFQGWCVVWCGGVGWCGWGEVGWVWWVDHVQSNLALEANNHYLHTPPSWQLLGITRGAKFNYNHTPNYLEFLREQKFNYNHTLKCVKLRLGLFIVYQKGDLVKQPMKKGSFVPKTISGVRQSGGGHYSTEYHKKCTCVTFNWIHFSNNDHIVDFLTLIYQQVTGPSDSNKYTDLWAKLSNNQSCNFLETYFCFGGVGGPKTTKVNFSGVN